MGKEYPRTGVGLDLSAYISELSRGIFTTRAGHSVEMKPQPSELMYGKPPVFGFTKDPLGRGQPVVVLDQKGDLLDDPDMNLSELDHQTVYVELAQTARERELYDRIKNMS